MGPGVRLTAEDIARIKHNLGLDRPLPIQYLYWLWGVLKGDWGVSYRTTQPVLEMIMERLPATMELMSAALFMCLAISIPLGVTSAIKRYSLFDYFVTTFSFVGYSIPVFWFGLMLIIIFAVKLGWLPAGSRSTPGLVTGFFSADHVKHLLLPSSMLALAFTASWSRYMRSSTLEQIRQDYVRTARAKGLAERIVIMGHIMRNAMIPVVTIITVQLPILFSGTILTEYVFAWPGMGSLLLRALWNRDYAVVQGVLIITAFLVVLFNLIADICYGFLDPRISYD